TIEFQNPQTRPIKATIEVYNILGQQVRRVFDGLAQPGLTRVVWDGRDEHGAESASGVYFYRLKTDQVTLARKMILLK
ncbi:MAG: T9SS type A sorting domain-containing protein, partial [candidate division Zixibacteria bacterium]|nr:T9SS type A sorting domain-containing protein [candidate division Zixibacteria bacterium]